MNVEVRMDEAALARFFADDDGPMSKLLTQRAVAVQNATKRNLSQPGTGRSYTRRSVTHQASAPGQPPAVDTGRLRASIVWELGKNSTGLYAEVGTNVAYALGLEVGTARVQPRPFLRPSLAEVVK
jgi:phage gpG-like protein